jgi:hypothetical protein
MVWVVRSRWPLTDAEVERHLGLAYDFMVDLLANEQSTPRRFDPSGERALHMAKVLRRRVMLEGTRTRAKRLVEAADEHFGLRDEPLVFWPGRDKPLPWRAPASSLKRWRVGG